MACKLQILMFLLTLEVIKPSFPVLMKGAVVLTCLHGWLAPSAARSSCLLLLQLHLRDCSVPSSAWLSAGGSEKALQCPQDLIFPDKPYVLSKEQSSSRFGHHLGVLLLSGTVPGCLCLCWSLEWMCTGTGCRATEASPGREVHTFAYVQGQKQGKITTLGIFIYLQLL